MNKAKIRELALANGFKLKQQPDGTMELNPYVYDFAAELMAEAVIEAVKFFHPARDIDAEALKSYAERIRREVK